METCGGSVLDPPYVFASGGEPGAADGAQPLRRPAERDTPVDLPLHRGRSTGGRRIAAPWLDHRSCVGADAPGGPFLLLRRDPHNGRPRAAAPTAGRRFLCRGDPRGRPRPYRDARRRAGGYTQQKRDKREIFALFAQKIESIFGDVSFPNLKLFNGQGRKRGV